MTSPRNRSTSSPKKPKIKKEPDETIPEPQPRIPDPSFYRSVVGPELARSVVYEMPKNGNPSYPPIKRKPNEDSQYDPRLWPPLETDNALKKNKKQCKHDFLLNDNEMADLAYIIGPRYGNNNLYQSHFYLNTEAQRRAYEIYGGPEGLRCAKKRHDEKEASKPRRSTRRRTSTASVNPRYTPMYVMPVDARTWDPEPDDYPGGDPYDRSLGNPYECDCDFARRWGLVLP